MNPRCAVAQPGVALFQRGMRSAPLRPLCSSTAGVASTTISADGAPSNSNTPAASALSSALPLEAPGASSQHTPWPEWPPGQDPTRDTPPEGRTRLSLPECTQGRPEDRFVTTCLIWTQIFCRWRPLSAEQLAVALRHIIPVNRLGRTIAQIIAHKLFLSFLIFAVLTISYGDAIAIRTAHFASDELVARATCDTPSFILDFSCMINLQLAGEQDVPDMQNCTLGYDLLGSSSDGKSSCSTYPVWRQRWKAITSIRRKTLPRLCGVEIPSMIFERKI